MAPAHKLISLLFAALITTSTVSAGLQVTGVYYDPVQAESGGEAVQLENAGNSPIALDSVTLATKQSVFSLPATTLLPGQGYLIADTGWSGPAGLRDNLSWPDADHEVGFSLANTDGFIELRDLTGSALDYLAWNSSNGSKAREGYMWTRSGEQAPSFRNSRSTQLDVSVSLIVSDAPPVFGNTTLTDDLPATPGIELLSFNRMIDVSVVVSEPNSGSLNVTLDWFGTTYTLNTTTNLSNTNYTFVGQVPFNSQPPGDYVVKFFATDGNNTVSTQFTITVLSSTSITTSGSLVLSGDPGSKVSGQFTVSNEGNVAKTVTVQNTIPGGVCDTTTVILAPDEDRDVTCTATIPNIASGTYSYVVRLTAS